MKIGLVTTSYPRTPADSRNAGVFVRAFALALAGRGHRVSILLPRRTGLQAGDPGLRVHCFGVPEAAASLTHLSVRRPDHLLRLGLLTLFGAAAAPGFAARGPLDHILAFWAIPSGWFARRASRASGCGYSVWVLGSDIWRAASYPAGIRIVRRVLEDADAVYADGVVLAEDAKRLSGREVTYLASSRILPVVPPRPDWDDGKRHLLFVGRFHEHKGPDLLLRAILSIPARVRAGLRVHFRGEGPLAPRLREMVNASPELRRTVELGGTIGAGELAASLRACDALVIPSRRESVPVLLSDAAQCDAPLVVTDVGDMGNLVAEFGAGFVARPEPAAIAEAVLAALAAGRGACQAGLDLLYRALNLETSVDVFLSRIGPGARENEAKRGAHG